MIKERYVNAEVARLLNIKGFDETCMSYFWSNGIDLSYTDIPFTKKNMYDGQILRPTQQMACDWIEETFNISIVVYVSAIGYLVCICYAHKDPYTASIGIQNDMPDGDNSDGSWSSKELAYNEALMYVLTNLI